MTIELIKLTPREKESLRKEHYLSEQVMYLKQAMRDLHKVIYAQEKEIIELKDRIVKIRVEKNKSKRYGYGIYPVKGVELSPDLSGDSTESDNTGGDSLEDEGSPVSQFCTVRSA
jgi:hypothetical protein